MGFSYASYENIIRREVTLSKTLKQTAGTGAQSRRLATALTAAAALAVGQTAMSVLREALFNAARFEDKDDDEIAAEMVKLGLYAKPAWKLESDKSFKDLRFGMDYPRPASVIPCAVTGCC